MMKAIVVWCPQCSAALDFLTRTLDFSNVTHPITVDALCPRCRDLFRVTVSMEKQIERPDPISVSGERP